PPKTIPVVAQVRPPQSPPPQQATAFESFTIRGTGWISQYGGPHPIVVSDGHLECVCAMDALIAYAYGAQYRNIDRVTLSPGASAPWYVVDAKLPQGAS